MRRSCSAAIRMGNTPAKPVPVASNTRWSGPSCEPLDEPFGKLPGAPWRQPSPARRRRPAGLQGQRIARRQARQDAVGEDAAGHAADVELQPDRPGRIALGDVRRGVARHRGARSSGARSCGDRSCSDRSKGVRRSGDRYVGDGEVAPAAVFQQQLHMLSRQPGVGPRVLQFDDELRHVRRQRQARHHARARLGRPGRRLPVRKGQAQVADRAALAHQQLVVGGDIGTFVGRCDAFVAAFQDRGAARAALAALTGEGHLRALGQRRVQDGGAAVRGEGAGIDGNGVAGADSGFIADSRRFAPMGPCGQFIDRMAFQIEPFSSI